MRRVPPPEVECAVIPAAGLGTRLLPATRSVPKELLPLGTTPVIDLVLGELAVAGLREAILVSSRNKPALDAHVAQAPLPVTVVHQAQPLGLGDAVLCARDAVGDRPFVVALPDALVTPEVTRMLLRALAGGAEGAIAVERVPAEAASRYGMVRRDDAGMATELVEKPGAAWTGDPLAIAARYVLPPEIFAALAATGPGAGGEVQLTDAIAALLASGARFAVCEIPPETPRRDVGSPEGYCAAFVERALNGDR